jgi:hypothetical protein
VSEKIYNLTLSVVVAIGFVSFVQIVVSCERESIAARCVGWAKDVSIAKECRK